MPKSNDLCPISESGDHRYFIFKVAEVFEVVDTQDYRYWNEDRFVPLYQKVEYAISGCNCGSSIKQRVVQQ